MAIKVQPEPLNGSDQELKEFTRITSQMIYYNARQTQKTSKRAGRYFCRGCVALHFSKMPVHVDG
ncbi:hypothetical protein CHS0354_014411 [Potamilus streckersoni]|uniref:Uncharacterized protein n=1 Tax=Potamilus streckersoni TaxID=2493646 RepID=A0AAE0SA30_9BIVA|nr:hypothetical protein CHS0354_014411 [Potamilus streckersoni]